MNAAQRRRLAMYGLSPEDWETLLEIQGHCCPICLRPFTATRPAAVDHAHTGQLLTRGALCVPCNYELTNDREDPARYRRMADYLENPPAARLEGERRRHRDAPPQPPSTAG